MSYNKEFMDKYIKGIVPENYPVDEMFRTELSKTLLYKFSEFQHQVNKVFEPITDYFNKKLQ